MSQNGALAYTIHSEHNFVYCKVEGTCQYQDFYQHTLCLMSDLQYRPGLNGLYDLSALTLFEGDESRWHALAEGVTSHELLPVPCNVAIIVPSLNCQISEKVKTFIEIAKGSNIDYKLFTPERIQSALMHIQLFSFRSLSDIEAL